MNTSGDIRVQIAMDLYRTRVENAIARQAVDAARGPLLLDRQAVAAEWDTRRLRRLRLAARGR